MAHKQKYWKTRFWSLKSGFIESHNTTFFNEGLYVPAAVLNCILGIDHKKYKDKSLTSHSHVESHPKEAKRIKERCKAGFDKPSINC